MENNVILEDFLPSKTEIDIIKSYMYDDFWIRLSKNLKLVTKSLKRMAIVAKKSGISVDKSLFRLAHYRPVNSSNWQREMAEI